MGMSFLIKLLSQFTIKFKVIAIVGVNLIAMGILMYLSISGLHQIGTEIKEIAEEDIPATERVTNITIHQLEQAIKFEQAIRFAYIMETAPDEVDRANAKKHYDKAKAYFLKLAKKVDAEILEAEKFTAGVIEHETNPVVLKEFKHVLKHLKKIEKEHKDFDLHVEDVFKLFEQGRVKEAEKLAEKVKQEEEQLDKALEGLLLELVQFTKKSALNAEHHEKETLSLIIIVSIVGTVVALGLSTLIILGIVQPLNLMQVAMGRMAEGNKAVIPSLDAKDEIGNIAKALDKINDIGQSAVRVQIALDNASSSVMLVGLDMNIAYTNNSLIEMFQKAQNDIQRSVPNFHYEQLIGSSVERLLADTDYHTGTFASLRGTHKDSFVIGGHIFDIAATPVVNPEGERLGTVIEWEDVTVIRRQEEQEKAVLIEVDSIVGACAKGDFSNRMKTEELDGFLLQLADGINSINEVSERGLTEIRNSMQAISDGDLSKTITGQYEGMFEDIKQACNNTLGQLDALIQDATEAATLAGKGDFSKVINATGKKGFMLELASGINAINEVSDRGLTEIRTSVQAIARGDLSQTINGNYEGMFDEIKQSFNGTLEQLRGIIENATHVAAAAGRGDFTQQIDATGKEGFMLELANGINSINEVSNRGLTEVKNILISVSDGDLSQKVTGTYEGMFAEIKASLNETIDKLSLIAQQMKSSADDVASASSEIATGSNDLSQRTETQASTLQETAASMEEMAATVQNNSNNASQANQLASDAKDAGVKGGSIVKDAVEAMVRIETSSSKIGDITSIIDEIAFQINLLALNAAVEAARAGEAGKGFEVVAAEVRKLAQRSANAAKDIAQLIEESGAEVKQGAKLVQDTGDSLEGIVTGITRLADVVSEITNSSQEQSTGIDQINTAVTEMDSMTQQNSALAEQNSAASQSLRERAAEMQERIAFFKVDGDQGVSGGGFGIRNVA